MVTIDVNKHILFQKCNIDGCQFIAHPKVITKHIQMQHSTGLYKKIANLNNPEEIKKWREERKKRYPTKSNIEKKAAERKEKIERGEKMFLNCDNKKEKFGANSTGNYTLLTLLIKFKTCTFLIKHFFVILQIIDQVSREDMGLINKIKTKGLKDKM